MQIDHQLPWWQPLQDNLMTQYAVKRLHHGVLVDAQTGLGRLAFMRALAASLLCAAPVAHKACGQCKSCQLALANSHPDYHEVSRGEKNTIGIDQIRQLIVKSHKKSQLGGIQVFVIHQVERMTTESANALLKTLEEPGTSTYLILSTERASALLPTIISRCQLYKQAAPELSELTDWLAQQGLESEAFSTIYNDFGGAPLLAAEQLQTDYLERRIGFMQNLKHVLAGRQVASSLYQGCKDEQIPDNLRWMGMAFQQWMKHKAQDEQARKANPTALLSIYELQQQVIKASTLHQTSGINKQLNYQQLCHKIQSMQSR